MNLIVSSCSGYIWLTLSYVAISLRSWLTCNDASLLHSHLLCIMSLLHVTSFLSSLSPGSLRFFLCLILPIPLCLSLCSLASPNRSVFFKSSSSLTAVSSHHNRWKQNTLSLMFIFDDRGPQSGQMLAEAGIIGVLPLSMLFIIAKS